MVAGLDPELVKLYERQRASAGVGGGSSAGPAVRGVPHRDRPGELARISAAAEDEVLRCPECGAILLRVNGIQQ